MELKQPIELNQRADSGDLVGLSEAKPSSKYYSTFQGL